MPKKNRIPGLTQNRGRWLYQPSSAGLPAGSPRPRAISLQTSDYAEAVAKVQRLRAQLDRSQPGHHALADLIPAYIASKERAGKYRPLTAKQVTAHLETLACLFSHRSVATISRADCLDAYAILRRDRTDATAHRYLRYLRAFYGWAIDIGYARENPAAALGIRAPMQSRRDEFLTREERDQVLTQALDHEAPDLQCVLMLGFHAGLRIGEIIAARRRWIRILDPGSGHLTVMEPTAGPDPWRIKNRRERVIPLDRTLLRFFGERYPLPEDPEAHIIHPEVIPGRSVYRWRPHYRWHRFRRQAGFQKLNFHTMRHTFGSLCAIAGVPEAKILRWMGITRATYERHYAGLQPSDREIELLD